MNLALHRGRDRAESCSVEGCAKPWVARGWCVRHWSRWSRHGDPLAGGPDRRMGGFWAKVEKTEACWLWNGPQNHGGYGRYHGAAHRYSWELVNGPVPVGLQIDHLCRVKLCVNPDHLEAVTPRENVMRSPVQPASINSRKTECIRGHVFDEANTYRNPRGTRTCKACRRLWDRARRAA